MDGRASVPCKCGLASRGLDSGGIWPVIRRENRRTDNLDWDVGKDSALYGQVQEGGLDTTSFAEYLMVVIDHGTSTLLAQKWKDMTCIGCGPRRYAAVHIPSTTPCRSICQTQFVPHERLDLCINPAKI